MHKAGYSPLLCGHTPRAGIELRRDGADPIVVPGPVHTSPREVAGPVDVLILAVKATQNDAARPWLTRLCDERTVVAVLQNGVEQVEQVQPHCPSSAVVPAIVWCSAETQPQGWVRLRGEAALVVPTGPAAEQFAGLLLSAASFTDGLTVQHTGSSLPSAPHIAMTAAMLRQAGVDIDDSTPNRWQVRPGPVAARRWDIEPDLTNAVAFLSAAVVSGGTVRITGWPRVSVQPADHILAILRQLNAVVIHADSSLEVRGPTGYDGFDVDLRAVGELTPSVAALAALASPGSVSRLSGIAHLRGHETDRLAALSTEINRLGGTCRETPDGLVITATPLRPGIWRAYADHRMAMAGAIIGLRVAGVEVDDIAATTKTLPEFPRLWAEMVGPGQGWGYPQPRSGQRARRATGQGSGG